jgi:hypothetical protein
VFKSFMFIGLGVGQFLTVLGSCILECSSGKTVLQVLPTYFLSGLLAFFYMLEPIMEKHEKDADCRIVMCFVHVLASALTLMIIFAKVFTITGQSVELLANFKSSIVINTSLLVLSLMKARRLAKH